MYKYAELFDAPHRAAAASRLARIRAATQLADAKTQKVLDITVKRCLRRARMAAWKDTQRG